MGRSQLLLKGFGHCFFLSSDKDIRFVAPDVYDDKDHHSVASIGAQTLHLGHQLVLYGIYLAPVCRFHVADAKARAIHGELFEIGGQHFAQATSSQIRGHSKDLFGVLVQVHAGQFGQVTTHLPVALCAGGRAEGDRVGENAAQQDAGHGQWNRDARFPVQPGNDGGRGTNHLVAEKDGRGGVHIGDAMVVYDAQDFGFLQPVYRLGTFVVVYQNNAVARRMQQITPRDDADQATIIAKHGQCSLAGQFGPHFVQQVVGMRRQHAGLHHRRDRDAHVEQARRRKGVVWRRDNGHAFLPGQGYDLVVHR